jgi:predicted permease
MNRPRRLRWNASLLSARLTGLGDDVRLALRLLRRQPGSAVVAVLLMTLAIGTSTVLFSVAYGVLVKPLPWRDADRLARLYEVRKAAPRESELAVTNLSYLAWQDHPSTILALAAWTPNTRAVSVAGEQRRLAIAMTTPNLFPLLGVRPLIGQGFAPEDGTPGRGRLVVLSHGLWQERFGGSRGAVGQTIDIDGHPHTVVGVMPRSFAFPDRGTRAWTPLHVEPVICGAYCRSFASFHAIARLAPGATWAQAAAEGTARVRTADPAARAAFGDAERPSAIAVVPLLAAETAHVRPAILVFLAAVGLLLATATANIAGVQLARAASRRREVAIRLALGAGGARLARQFLVESLLLGLSGGAGGLALAVILCRLLPSLLPPAFPRLDDIAIDLPAMAFVVGVTVLTSLVFGMLPALYARRVNLVESLAEVGRAVGGRTARSHTRSRLVLVTGQMAIASILLVGAALLTRSFVGLITADLGYDPTAVLKASVWLDDLPGARQTALLNTILERLRGMPGVTAAALATEAPLDSKDPLRSLSMPSPSGGPRIEMRAALRLVSASYFATMHIRLVEGRGFTDADLGSPRYVVLVNRAFATRYLGDRAIGRSVPAGPFERQTAEVVGIVDDVRQRNVAEAPAPAAYQLYRQPPGARLSISQATIFARTTGDPTALAPHLRALVRQLDPSVVVDGVQTLEDLRDANLARPRLYSVLLGSLAACAVAIAGVGLFAALAYGVAVRSREIGVRTALGARPTDIVRLVVGEALRVAIAGVAFGVLVAFGFVRYLSTFLYGMTPYDLPTFIVVTAVVLAVAIVASLVPARRAARVDPIRILRG